MPGAIDAHIKASYMETELYMVDAEYFQRQKDLATAVEYEKELLENVIKAHDYELSELEKKIQNMEDETKNLQNRIENRVDILERQCVIEKTDRDKHE